MTMRTDGVDERHEEIVTRDGPRMRIEFPSGTAFKGQVIVEGPKERRHFLPDSNEVRILAPRRNEGLERLRALARTGSITAEPGGKIAGLATVEVTVRDAAGNLLQRLAIEPNVGMILRRRVYDPTGLEVGGFVYTTVDLSPAPFDASLFRIERKGVQTTTPWDALRRLAKRDGFLPLGLPASTGFRLDEVQVRRLPEGPVMVQTYRGEGRVSLFQLRVSVSPERLRRQGRAVHSVSWTRDGVTFVLIGPKDVASLERLKGTLGSGP